MTSDSSRPTWKRLRNTEMSAHDNPSYFNPRTNRSEIDGELKTVNRHGNLFLGTDYAGHTVNVYPREPGVSGLEPIEQATVSPRGRVEMPDEYKHALCLITSHQPRCPIGRKDAPRCETCSEPKRLIAGPGIPLAGFYCVDEDCPADTG